jgi:insertion element IS1 protein InsB
MTSNITSCIKRVGGKEICSVCDGFLIKHGKSAANKTRYLCGKCRKTKVENYSYNAYYTSTNDKIVQLIKEGLGIRSTARVIGISPTTLLKRIIGIANCIEYPVISFGKTYEVDEMRTYIKRKTRLIWIVYALERETKKVVGFAIGARTNVTLNVVLKSLQLSKAKKIYTDGLKNYKFLIKKSFKLIW